MSFLENMCNIEFFLACDELSGERKIGITFCGSGINFFKALEKVLKSLNARMTKVSVH